MGQVQGSDPNYEVHGDLFKPSNILLSPSSNPSKDGEEFKTNNIQGMKALDPSSTIAPEFGWQRPAEKFQSGSPNAGTPRIIQGADADLYEDCWKPIQDPASVIEQTTGDSPQLSWNEPFSSTDFLDQDIWGTCIDQEWLESNVT